MSNQDNINGVLGSLFDMLTTGSPLKSKPIREAIKAIGGVLTTIGEPVAVGFGTSLVALTKIFDLREEKKRKRRNR